MYSLDVVLYELLAEASVAGLAGWSEETGVVCGDGGRLALNRAGRSDRMAAWSLVSGKCRAKGCTLDERVLSVWTNYDPPSR